ncbi:MAG: hypothetical protein R3A44_41990 [Caldilineaceae bacterium]
MYRIREQFDDYDSPWKDILDRYFPEFMVFFFPQAFADIDWDRGFEFLDKELQRVVREAEGDRHIVDKLVKVWLHDGEENWLLIHIDTLLCMKTVTCSLW